jgi:hypothetical protein
MSFKDVAKKVLKIAAATGVLGETAELLEIGGAGRGLAREAVGLGLGVGALAAGRGATTPAYSPSAATIPTTVQVAPLPPSVVPSDPAISRRIDQTPGPRAPLPDLPVSTLPC